MPLIDIWCICISWNTGKYSRNFIEHLTSLNTKAMILMVSVLDNCPVFRFPKSFEVPETFGKSYFNESSPLRVQCLAV